MQRTKSLQNSLEKLKNKTFGHSGASKKMPHFDHFPVLGNLTHIGHLLLDGGVVINKQEISDYFFYSSKP